MILILQVFVIVIIGVIYIKVLRGIIIGVLQV